MEASYEELKKYKKNVLSELRKNRNMSRIESDYTKNKPEVKLITIKIEQKI
jgi:HAE1 family hydrophobic/amphiphilic exporter-1/multidrug efflux pump